MQFTWVRHHLPGRVWLWPILVLAFAASIGYTGSHVYAQSASPVPATTPTASTFLAAGGISVTATMPDGTDVPTGTQVCYTNLTDFTGSCIDYTGPNTSITDLAAGTYQVYLTTPPGYHVANPSTIEVTVSDNTTAAVQFQVVANDTQITKTVDNPTPKTGSTVTYTIHVTDNVGYPLVMEDTLPQGLSIDSTTIVCEGQAGGLQIDSNCAYYDPNGYVRVNFRGDGNPGETDFTVSIPAQVQPGYEEQPLENVACLRSTVSAVPASGLSAGAVQQPSTLAQTPPGCASATITPQPIPTTVTKTVDKQQALDGETVVYTIEFSGRTPQGGNYQIADSFPTGFTQTSISCEYTSFGQTQSDCGYGNLVSPIIFSGPNSIESGRITVTGTVNGDPGDVITNQACMQQGNPPSFAGVPYFGPALIQPSTVLAQAPEFPCGSATTTIVDVVATPSVTAVPSPSATPSATATAPAPSPTNPAPTATIPTDVGSGVVTAPAATSNDSSTGGNSATTASDSGLSSTASGNQNVQDGASSRSTTGRTSTSATVRGLPATGAGGPTDWMLIEIAAILSATAATAAAAIRRHR